MTNHPNRSKRRTPDAVSGHGRHHPMNHLDTLFAEANTQRATQLEKMATDYRGHGDLVSAQNCEAKACELRHMPSGKLG